MAITRIGFIALSDSVKQEEAVAMFNNFATECKKDGQSYILSSKASKCKVLTDVPGSQPWSIVYEITFASEEDMEYYQTKDPVYQDLMKQAAEGKATGFIAVSAEF